MSNSPRPDQRHTASLGGGAGSRSGSGDVAGALGYPGVPAAIPNCDVFTALQVNAGSSGRFGVFPSPGRIWMVLLSYAITSNDSFTGTARTLATVTLNSGVPLAIVQLGVADPDQHDSGTAVVPYAGLPVTQGESVFLTAGVGGVVTDLDQQASAVVLYSLP